MTLLFKDHKHFEIGDIPPSRSVMAGKVTNISVKSLYPSLSDVKVAVIRYEVIMRSGIRFVGINFWTAGKNVAVHLTKEEQAIQWKAGGPIGLCASCAVAQIVMNAWDLR
jgi:hypothetical protein